MGQVQWPGGPHPAYGLYFAPPPPGLSSINLENGLGFQAQARTRFM